MRFAIEQRNELALQVTPSDGIPRTKSLRGGLLEMMPPIKESQMVVKYIIDGVKVHGPPYNKA